MTTVQRRRAARTGCARHGVPSSRVDQRWGEAERQQARVGVCRCCCGPASLVPVGMFTTGGTAYDEPLCQLCREVEDAPPPQTEEDGTAPATVDEAGQVALGGEDWR